MANFKHIVAQYANFFLVGPRMNMCFSANSCGLGCSRELYGGEWMRCKWQEVDSGVLYSF
jgi:hypothetical protein